jgi:adenylate cyclase
MSDPTPVYYPGMGQEIERTFLVDPEKLPKLPQPLLIEQGYLSEDPCVRVRLVNNERGYVTVKGRGMKVRDEWEWEVPAKDAQEILSKGLWLYAVIKRRYQLGPWVVDQFRADLEGLWLAEIELKNPEDPVDIPPWTIKEVTDRPEYTNVVLARAGIPPV